MIYDVTAKNTDVKTYSVDGFTAGIDKSKNETDIDDKALSDVCNMWLDGGKIKTRPGSQCIFGCEVSDDNASNARVIYSGNVICKDYIGLKILVMQLEYVDKIVLKLVVQSDNGLSKCIMLNTTNKAEYEADITLNCFAFSDSKIHGCGIYLLVGVIDEDLNVLDKRIYELSENMNAFSVISQTEIYSPMVYVNGKGNKYYTLTKTDRNYPAGSKLEDANLLTGAFRAAYKTDGVSNSFMLPYKIIGSGAGQSITVKFTEADGILKTFTIPNNATVSNAVTIGEDSVYAGINRLTGKLSFYKTGGVSFALPYVDDVYNNLEIKAYRAFTDDRLFLMRKFENYGSHVFLFGSLDEPSKIYWSSKKHPLYFPVGSSQQVGDGFQSVTAMAKQNNLLIIFKSHEIYYISGVKDSEYDIDEVLCGNVRSVSGSSSITVNQQNGSIGCKYPETVLLCANRLVFLGSDRCVYALTSTAMSQKQVYMISRQINSKIVEVDCKMKLDT